MSQAVRGFVAGALLLSLSPVALAKTAPTDGQVAQVQHLLGFDQAFSQAMDAKIDGAPELAQLSAGQRSCVGGIVRPAFAGALNNAFRDLFVDSTTVEDWVRFSQTPGGSRFLEFVRTGVLATVRQQPRPEPATFMQGLSPEQLADVGEFMSSPAATVLQRDFPDIDLPQAQQVALERQVKDECGVELPRG